MSFIDDLLESIVCPRCGHRGVDSDGGYDWVCPNCDYEGYLDNEDSEDEIYENIEE